jgi:hypothetical protein
VRWMQVGMGSIQVGYGSAQLTAVYNTLLLVLLSQPQ